MALAVAACTTTGDITGSIAGASGLTVALESIDGPPPAIVQKIARDLSAAAQARRIVVVDRNDAAVYRMRGYLATHADKSGTSIAWAWDIYDAQQHRVFRVRGEDKASAGGQSWSAADETTLLRIVRASLDEMLGYLAARPAGGGQIARLLTPHPRQRRILVALDEGKTR